MARAYRYAVGRGPKPPEIEAGEIIDRFGAAAWGKPLTRAEIHDIRLAETIVGALRQRELAESIAEWAQDNAGLQKLLVDAERAANGR
jgi:hypothetical protein